MRRYLTTIILALGLCAPVQAAGLVEIAMAGGVFSYGDPAFVGATVADPYAALFAAIDASNPTLEYNALREFVAGNYADSEAVTSATEWVSGTYPATQGTASAQPTFIASANGGHPAFRFDGGDWLRVTGFTVTQPNSMMVVVDHANASGTEFYVDGYLGGNRQIIQRDTSTCRIWAGSYVPGGTVNGDPHSIYAVYDGASSSLSIDGSTTSPLSPGTGSLDGITTGSRDDGALNFVGDIQIGPIIWDTPPSSAQIDAIEAELEALGLVTLP